MSSFIVIRGLIDDPLSMCVGGIRANDARSLNERRRFGYRRLLDFCGKARHQANRIYRLYREEGLTVRKRPDHERRRQ